MVMTLAQRLDAARAALASARERDRITESLVHAAAIIAPRVALFGVKREGLRVLGAPGSALRLSEGLVLPLPEGGLLERAINGQGPMHLLIEPILSFAVGQPLGIPCVFEPVLAGGRTVLMLYIDRAGVAFDPTERAVVRELCDTARQSLEALLRLLGWVVPGGQAGAGPANSERSRPAVRSHLAVTVEDPDAPEGPDEPVSSDLSSKSLTPTSPSSSPSLDQPGPSDTSAHDPTPAREAVASDDSSPPVSPNTSHVHPDMSAPPAEPVSSGTLYRQSKKSDAPSPIPVDPDPPGLGSGSPSVRADDAEPIFVSTTALREIGPGESASASRSRGGRTRGRPVITLLNPIRRDDMVAVVPLPARGDAHDMPPRGDDDDERDEQDQDDRDDDDDLGDLDDDDLDDPGPDDDSRGTGLGLRPVPVPLGPDTGPDSPLVARFAALAAVIEQDPDAPASDRWPERSTAAPSSVDLHLPAGTDETQHALVEPPAPVAAAPAPVVDLPDWIATPEPSGIEDPLPVAAALLSADLTTPSLTEVDPSAGRRARARRSSDDDATVDPVEPASDRAHALSASAAAAPLADDDSRLADDDAADTMTADVPVDDEPLAAEASHTALERAAASDTPTVLEIEPIAVIPESPESRLAERAAPDAPTVLDIQQLATSEDAPVAPAALIPNLIAPPGTPGARGGLRAAAAASEPLLVIPKTLRRSTALTASPHPMARRAERAGEHPGEAPKLSIPITLIGPRGGRRRGKHEPRPEAPPPELHMPRLVPEAASDPAAASDPEATSPTEHVSHDMTIETAPEEHVVQNSEDPPAVATASARSDDEVDAVIEAFLQGAAEWSGVEPLRALDEGGLARLAARFPGPIDLVGATNFPPPSAHGPLLRACVELGLVVGPHVLGLLASTRPQIRFYAAFLFQELRDSRCLGPLAELAFDPDPDVRLIATRVLESYNRVPDFAAVAAGLRDELDSRARERQLLAVEAAGTLRDTLAVPRLIDLLAVRDKHVREAALEALCSITAKHHGYRAARWRAWYGEHGHEPRIEWVIDGLRHRDVAVRRWAADELARITGQRIPFPAEGDRRSRDLALRAWQAWWDSNREHFAVVPETMP